MLNLKKTAVAVLALGSSAVFAGTMGPVCTPGNVTVPCERSAWDVGIYALYLQPINSAPRGYAFAQTSASPVTTTFHDYNNDWNWGVAVDASYHFNTGNDITVSGYFFDGDSNGGLFTTSTTPATTGFNRNDIWNAVNVELGQYVDFSANKKMRFHGGVQWAQIESTLSPFPVTTGISTANDFSSFNGAGPRTGIDMMYMFGNGFGVYAKGAAALLVGTSKFVSGQGLVAGGQTTPTGFPVSGSKNAVVPELEAKLGAAYTYAMASGDLSLDVYGLWNNYFNATHNTTLTGTGLFNAGNPIYVTETDTSYVGVGFGLKYVGNMM